MGEMCYSIKANLKRILCNTLEKTSRMLKTVTVFNQIIDVNHSSVDSKPHYKLHRTHARSLLTLGATAYVERKVTIQFWENYS